MKSRGFTLIESAVVILVTTIILGAGLAISNLGRSFLNFQEEKFLLADALKKAHDLSFKSIELYPPLVTHTSTICGVGVLFSSSTNSIFYRIIAYATHSGEELVDCYKVASDSPEYFDFTSKQPELYYTRTNELTTSTNNQFVIQKELNRFRLNFSYGSPNWSTTSIMFLHPYGEVLIYQDNRQIASSTSFSEFYLTLTKNNETATITITNTGQITSE